MVCSLQQPQENHWDDLFKSKTKTLSLPPFLWLFSLLTFLPISHSHFIRLRFLHLSVTQSCSPLSFSSILPTGRTVLSLTCSLTGDTSVVLQLPNCSRRALSWFCVLFFKAQYIVFCLPSCVFSFSPHAPHSVFFRIVFTV